MKKTGVLGKGLSSLIPENDFQDSNNEQVISIDINLIKPNKDQPRKHFDNEKLIELANSIKEHGIIQPIVVRKENQFYVIIAGERRWRAAKLLNLKEVPIIIKELSDVEVVQISLIENIIREDLNPIEEATAYNKLLNDFNLTQEEISKQVSKSRSAIANSLRLLNLDERIQGYLIEGVLSEGHGRAILALENKEDQYVVAQKVIDENLNVRQTELLVRSYYKDDNNKYKKINNKSENDIYYKDIRTKLENHFNTKVCISNNSKNKGKIEIEYYSPEDLQRIIEILNI
ncbi:MULTISPECIES: ParB/RepB/Spo0J family partition protein [unclassified Clostridium]|uniref:ParB/RepB/Spo0J family partition protein n=1 Tax=unclassified Clostridium TaxID=2614128 RepID=UPI000E8B516C|nr:ParB/RepB/Spo0J family partition protein [Escherichia coli]HAY3898178.1 ParB/RepB/Spo0J family partition protein [Escherichia coli]HAY3977442.1 ParB/RepB/Spo0J family partition protein [Escherichia coli]HBB9211739.1 ParB/RepB/Spo0J family partition protein [Escherichia coli]HBL05963.1 chromosome partitioning protein ParB [Clostridium sp.]